MSAFLKDAIFNTFHSRLVGSTDAEPKDTESCLCITKWAADIKTVWCRHQNRHADQQNHEGEPRTKAKQPLRKMPAINPGKGDLFNKSCCKMMWGGLWWLHNVMKVLYDTEPHVHFKGRKELSCDVHLPRKNWGEIKTYLNSEFKRKLEKSSESSLPSCLVTLGVY